MNSSNSIYVPVRCDTQSKQCKKKEKLFHDDDVGTNRNPKTKLHYVCWVLLFFVVYLFIIIIIYLFKVS